ncbi:MAG: hypothetical protein IT346_03445 [Epsilonproteobacteria bacterium]|nr:hypothetical protein [Campylobacterota bacterium]
MNQTKRNLFLAAALLIGEQSICSHSGEKAGWLFSSFNFSSWTMSAWPAALSFSSFRSACTVPTLSQDQKDTAKKWAPCAAITGISFAGALWTYRKYKAQGIKTPTNVVATTSAEQIPVDDTNKCYLRTLKHHFQRHDCLNKKNGTCHCHTCPTAAQGKCSCNVGLKLYSKEDIYALAKKEDRKVILNAANPRSR